ncbi:flagellar basal-body rod protein FlgF [Pseudolabrys sp. FHR47]|uniref:flagellar basal-body rod protein FlgF n=1 Tax=Pseudolabrys sp. FHR47 TaxID=2562284 RepID=UPI0010BE95D8|nr:flagellar basal-body rod protein FlgF [Pseudolabrys sp. FHR47]
MQNTLLVGLSRQVVLRRELDVVANNIANVNTAGFKADGAVFEEFIGKVARSDNMSNRDRQVSFVRDRATWTDFSQGSMERTGNATDVAINGNGFFAVQTPAGERYTRNGGFQINNEGQLVTSEGFPVLGDNGPIQFQRNDVDIRISGDGTVSVSVPGNSAQESQRGKLRMVGVENPAMLQKVGQGTFALKNGATIVPDTQSKFVQGSVEKSNVRSVVEMTRMIEITRTYTQVANMMQQQADLSRNAIDKLAEVPA